MFSIDGFSGHAVGALQRSAQYKLPNKRGHSSPQKQLFSTQAMGSAHIAFLKTSRSAGRFVAVCIGFQGVGFCLAIWVG
ncbi:MULTISPECIES: hypothetical protein [unclassified Hydrogenophaga]|uniref:hypothetical protein n=1 Tax=unclassified Hydrogenophaga TaxID=2610897 RepID=UPI00131F8BB8|nr:MULTISPECIES: hypothetical protein [unclassified Hydrogenophaga]QHE78704.1 hypothetical protein F9Z45_21470 [Hydrogenophaga sp. PBL-H3]QHE83129.1 hypothetical protein F9Z44_21470 [Hydrogenophaga sp. PBL-H3]